MKMAEKVRESLDRGKVCGVLQIDLKEASDSSQRTKSPGENEIVWN